MDIKATLTRKIGPLPLWGWGAVVAGGAYIGRKVLANRGGTSTASIAGTGDLAETGFGESAVPYDVTGRAPASGVPESDFGDFLPIPEFIDYADSPGDGFDPPPVPGPVVQPPVTGSGFVQTCDRPHLQPRLGGYAGAPNRECPHGWHLNRVPFTRCHGWCVQN